jgi:hypothetical protein
LDPREKINDQLEMLQAAMDGRQVQIWTACPGIIVSFNETEMTAEVQPAIQAKFRAPNGVETDVTLPLLLDCPVVFPGGGGCTLTFPIKKDDECLVVFGARCIDNWWASGGIQPQAELRMHDLSDGFVLAGVRSQPRRFDVSTTTAQLRSDSGQTFAEIDPAGEILNIVSPNPVTINAPGLVVSGYIHAAEDVVGGQDSADQVSLQRHVHGGVVRGGSTTDSPVPRS